MVFNAFNANITLQAKTSITLQGTVPLVAAKTLKLTATDPSSTITVGAPLSSTSSITLVAGTGAGGGITLNAPVSTTATLSLTGGTVTQSTAGIITANALTGNNHRRRHAAVQQQRRAAGPVHRRR